jgi:phytanoyl-CoA hydroxylase
METLLSSAQIEDFRKDGYLLLKGFVPVDACDEMLAVAREHVQQAIAPLEYEADVGYAGAPSSLDAPGGRTARRLRAAWQRDDHFRAWASNPRLVTALHQLFEEPVCITLSHHNCVMTKHPTFGTATGWHRDIRYWSFPRNELISVWLALGPENADNGGLKFIPGSHLLQLQPEQMDELDFLRPEVAANQALFEQGISVPLEKGDVVLFHSGLFHAAGKNNSAQIKSSVVFAYHGQSNPPVPGTRSAASDDVLLD